MIEFQQYIKDLQSEPIERITEHSKRRSLENLLIAIAETSQNKDKIKILHEPRRKENYGAPDFLIYTINSIIGYVENKKITENLDKILKSEQIKKYRELSQNILLTNYLDFVWIKGDLIERETLCYQSDLENKKFKLDNDRIEKVNKLVLNFFSQEPYGIATPKELALALAIRCKNLKVYLTDELSRQDLENNKGMLYDLYYIFKSHIFNELTISEFGDAFAQMLVYGLFLAKLNMDNVATGHALSLHNAKQYIPSTFQLIQELVRFLDQLDNPEYIETKWIIDETISIMNNLDLFELKKSLTFSKKVKESENIETDPYIYFYETFLTAYDSQLRKSKGVYYTPPQVVNFIVRAINDVLKNVFNITGGFAARNIVTVLDFATGTGTFLLEIFKQIFDTLPTDSKAKRDLLIKEHILKNIYGFEYLIAPYTIAHLKLSQFLKENDYIFQTNERLQIFLTNTLEPIDKQLKIPLLPALTKESQSAQEIKDKPILVITGNPPYSVVSKNKGEWISNLIEDYKYVDGVHFNEKKHSLQDDYVKFIRFAQDKMEKVEQGIIGIITNHSFLDNPTFRGMRKSLMTTFDQLYFIDLHGNAKKKEKTPDGEKDENVFDIEQGVTISIFIKKKGIEKKVYHTDFWGVRSQKYKMCLDNSFDNLDFSELNPIAPYFFFVPKDETNKIQYDSYIPLSKIFAFNSMGFVTGRDNFLINFDNDTLWKKMQMFSKMNTEHARQEYNLGKDSRDWTVATALKDLNDNFDQKNIVKVSYRPFDNRFTFYTGNSRGLFCSPQRRIMNCFVNKNIALICVRIGRDITANNYFVTKYITDKSIVSSLDNANVFPLYIYEKQSLYNNVEPINKAQSKQEKDFLEHKKAFEIAEREFFKHKKVFESIKKPSDQEIGIFEEHRMGFEETQTMFDKIKENYENELLKLKKIQEQNKKEHIEILENGLVKRPNFANDFSKFIKNKYDNQFTPEQILGYIYAILYSDTYRKKYAEFLKIDYPKISFTDDIQLFIRISKLGNELIQKHLQKEIPQGNEYKELGLYKGSGDNLVVKPEFKNLKTENGYRGMLYISKNQHFDNVPEYIYDFHIGGYQILEKYLKDRKNKVLTFDEIENIENVVKIIAFTIKQKEKIEIETKNWI